MAQLNLFSQPSKRRPFWFLEQAMNLLDIVKGGKLANKD